MIKKRIKKIGEITILIAVRQFWKLGENVYRLFRQPLLTIKTLIKERDKSQIFLLFIMAIFPIILYILARIIWDLKFYGSLVNAVGLTFIATMIVEIAIFTFFGYWLLKIWRNR